MTAPDPLAFDPVVAKVCQLQAKAQGLDDVGKPATALSIRLHAERILGRHLEGNTQWIEQEPTTPRRAPQRPDEEIVTDDGMVTDDGAGVAWAVGLVVIGALLSASIALLLLIEAARVVIHHPEASLLIAMCVASAFVGASFKRLLTVKR